MDPLRDPGLAVDLFVLPIVIVISSKAKASYKRYEYGK